MSFKKLVSTLIAITLTVAPVVSQAGLFFHTAAIVGTLAMVKTVIQKHEDKKREAEKQYQKIVNNHSNSQPIDPANQEQKTTDIKYHETSSHQVRTVKNPF
jgi:hypothetical protein